MNREPKRFDTSKKAYVPPVVRTQVPQGAQVLLACTGRIDCDLLFSTGPCCAATEEECANC